MTGIAGFLNDSLPLDHGAPESWTFEPFPAAAIEQSVPDRFDIIAGRFPGRPAITDGDSVLNYADAAALAARIAEAVINATGDREGSVVVLLKHELRYPVTIPGVLAAGRGCIPLDAAHPAERNRLIASHAGAAAVIVSGSTLAAARDLFPDVPLVDLDCLPPPAAAHPRSRCGPDDLACVIYTSGSTGMPKGVFQNHRGVLHDIMQSVNHGHIGCDDRLALFYSPTVIAGLRVSLSALLSGASLHVLSPADLGPAGIASAIRTARLTVLRSSPTLFRHVAESLEPGIKLESVRLVALGGERVSWADFDLFKAVCRPSAAMAVHLGATECWTLHSQWYVDESVRTPGSRLPVGHAVPDRVVRILRADGTSADDGEPGECVVSSRYLALGYWRNPELTRSAFSSDPLHPDMRIYRTGDLVVRRSDGLLEHVGRSDDQIKLAGRRVEPGEIESALRQCTGIKDAALVIRRTESGAPRSVDAYVELRPEAAGLLPRHIKALLSQRVPRHMVPASVAIVESLPRLASFKIDRTRLAAMDAAHLPASEERTEIALLDAVAKVFEEVLGIAGATADDTLWSLGGDSLQAIKLVTKLENRFGIRVPMDTFEATDSIRALARWIDSERRSHPEPNGSSEGAEGPPARREKASRDARLAVSAERDDVRTWSAAIDRLFQSGDLENARQEARDLHTAFPRLQYGDRLYEIFDRIPSDGGYLRFDNDPHREVKIVRRDGADTVVLLFCGNMRNLGVPLPVVHQWLGRLPATIIYLRDFRRAHYFTGLRFFGPDRASMLAGLRKLTEGRRVICWGTSSGAVAALHYGLDLRAESVVAFAGPINFSREFNVYLRAAWLATRLRSTAPQEIIDLREAYRSAERPPRALLVYADNNWDDRLHAEYMRGLPTVRFLAIENHREHNVIMEVIARGWFERVLDWSITPGGTELPPLIPDAAAPAETSSLQVSHAPGY